MEIGNLLKHYYVYNARLEELLQKIKEKLSDISYNDKLLKIKGVGLITVSRLITEVVDFSRFEK